MRRVVIVGTVGVLALAGATRTAAQASRDSAGVRIISVERLSGRPATLRLADSPRLVVGGADDDAAVEFEHNQGYLRGALLRDGGLAVIDVTRVHRFDRSGKRLGITGRKGQGPGEFLYLGSICASTNDTLIVQDSHNRRLGVIAPDGRFVRHISTNQLGSVPFDACFSDGSLLIQAPATRTADGMELQALLRLDLQRERASRVFERTTFPFNMGTQSQNLEEAMQNRLLLSDADRGELALVSLEGRLERVLKLVDPRDALTSSEIARQTAGAVGGMSQERRAEVAARAAATPHPGTWPAFASVAADPSGRIWVQDKFFPQGSQKGWTAIDADGKFVARLELPATAASGKPRIIAFGKNEVLVRLSDEDGFASLAVYPLVPVR